MIREGDFGKRQVLALNLWGKYFRRVEGWIPIFRGLVIFGGSMMEEIPRFGMTIGLVTIIPVISEAIARIVPNIPYMRANARILLVLI
ncbi:unnamed protein product, partial [Dovyalis caffra]